mgnify:FL=1
MSTYYKLGKKVRIKELLDGCLEPFGITAYLQEFESGRWDGGLSDGENYLNVAGKEYIDFLGRYSENTPLKIFKSISDCFQAPIYSEYSPEYNGENSDRKWDDFGFYATEGHVDEAYNLAMAEIKSMGHAEPDTYWWFYAQVAGRLVSDNPALAFPERLALICSEFINEWFSYMTRKPDKPFEITDRLIEQIRLAVSLDEELPQA